MIAPIGKIVQDELSNWINLWNSGQLDKDKKGTLLRHYGGTKDDLGGYLVNTNKPGYPNLRGAALKSYIELRDNEFFD